MVQTHRHDTTFWRLMSTGLWFAAMMAIVIAGLGNPTGLGLLFDVVVYGSLGTIAVVLAFFWPLLSCRCSICLFRDCLRAVCYVRV